VKQQFLYGDPGPLLPNSVGQVRTCNERKHFVLIEVILISLLVSLLSLFKIALMQIIKTQL